MTIKSEISLENFEAWSGGKYTLNRIINEGKCSQLEAILEDLYPDGMTNTEQMICCGMILIQFLNGLTSAHMTRLRKNW